eukprot:scaffold787_cov99-Skeletonema_marinoi.AAC.3
MGVLSSRCVHFFTKSETPESKSSTKSSNFEAEAHLLKINAFSWNSLFAQLYSHNLSVQQTMHPLTAVPYSKDVEMTCVIALFKQLSCALKPAITIDASLLAPSAIPATAAS